MKKPRISIIMGSKSDWPTMQHTSEMLNELNIEHEVKVVSAHRTPDLLYSFAESARKKGIEFSIDMIVSSHGELATKYHGIFSDKKKLINYTIKCPMCRSSIYNNNDETIIC